MLCMGAINAAGGDIGPQRVALFQALNPAIHNENFSNTSFHKWIDTVSVCE